MKKQLMILMLWVLGTTLLLAACNVQPHTPARLPNIPIEPQAQAWQLLGGALDLFATRSADSPSLALDTSGKPVIAWYEYDGTSYNIYVKRLHAGAWSLVGLNPLDVEPSKSADRPSLALDSNNNPVVAWREGDNIYVKRFDGNTWNLVGTGPLNINAGFSTLSSSLVLDKSNNPVVAWIEGDKISFNLYVKRWNGSAWVMLGTGPLDIDPEGDTLYKDIALDAAGNPVVAWAEDYNIHVKRWNGSSWNSLGTALDVGLSNQSEWPSLEVDTTGKIVITWHEIEFMKSDNIYVKRWNGNTWNFIGTNPVSQHGTTPSLTLDANNNPVVSWAEFVNLSATNVQVKRFDGTNWNFVGNNPLDVDASQYAYPYAIALDASGNPTLTWIETVKGRFDTNVYVKRFISNGWQPFGNALDDTLENDAFSSSVTRKSNDRPVVTWQEMGNVYVKEWAGSTWLTLGTKLNTNSGFTPLIAMRSDDRPVVAWIENGNQIRVKFWNGSSWQNQGNLLANTIQSFALAVGSANNPIVAYSAFGNDGEASNLYVKRWNGTAWVGMNGNATVAPLDIDLSRDAQVPALAVDNTGKPAVAWMEFAFGIQSIYVKQWTGTAWVQRGTNLETSPANNPSIDIDSTGKPVVAWEERVFDGANTQTNIYTKRWSGTAWVKYGTGQAVDKILSSQAFDPVVQLRSDNTPIIAMTQTVFRDGTSSQDVYMRRWNVALNRWVDLGVLVDNNPAFNAKNPSFVLRSNNNPIVSWDEDDGSSYNVYVRQF
jgi:hypothetical protein